MYKIILQQEVIFITRNLHSAKKYINKRIQNLMEDNNLIIKDTSFMKKLECKQYLQQVENYRNEQEQRFTIEVY